MGGESGGDVGGARHGMSAARAAAELERKWEDTNRKWRWKL